MKIEEERKKKRKGRQHQIEDPLTTRAVYVWRGHQGGSNAASKAYVWPPEECNHYPRANACNKHINHFVFNKIYVHWITKSLISELDNNKKIMIEKWKWHWMQVKKILIVRII